MDTAHDYVALLAAVLLLASMAPVRRLVSGLPKGPTRRGWYLLATLLVVMIAVDVVYALGLLIEPSAGAGMLPSLLLLLGSGFIAIVSFLSVDTVRELRMLDVLSRQARTDALTGLFNRRYFDVELADAIARARRERTPLSVIMLDLDHFKAVNDRHGHAAGDAVLMRVADVARALCRAGTTVARLGGEEMAIIAPATTERQAQRLAERLRAGIADLEIPVPPQAHGERRLRVTASFGLAQLRAEDHSGAALLHRSDCALYAAKLAGRNRVRVAGGQTLPEIGDCLPGARSPAVHAA